MTTSQEIETNFLIIQNSENKENQNFLPGDELNKKSRSIKEEIIDYFSKINWVVFLLISFFVAFSSYTGIGALWTELPFMVDQLKEGWRLPTLLSGTGMVAQLGTLVNILLFTNY